MITRKYSPHDTTALEELYYFTRMQIFIPRANKNKFKIDDYQNSTIEDDVWIANLGSIITEFVSVYTKDSFIHNLFLHTKYQGRG